MLLGIASCAVLLLRCVSLWFASNASRRCPTHCTLRRCCLCCPRAVEEWESTHPADVFAQESFIFTARRSSVLLRFENDSPVGARTVLIDKVEVLALVEGRKVPVRNPSFELGEFCVLLCRSSRWLAVDPTVHTAVI